MPKKRALIPGACPRGKVGIVKAGKHIQLPTGAIAQGFGLVELGEVVEHGSQRTLF